MDEAFLRKIHLELLVWAAGAKTARPPIEGLDTVSALTSKEYCLDSRDLHGRRVLVIGGGLVGLEAAEKLAEEGREVIGAEMLAAMGRNMEAISKELLFKRLKSFSGLTLFTSTTVLRIDKEALVVKGSDGVRSLPPVESVLLAVGLRPEPIPEAFKALVPEVQVVGMQKFRGTSRALFRMGMKLPKSRRQVLPIGLAAAGELGDFILLCLESGAPL